MATDGDNNGKPPLMKRSVVSSFLYKFTKENGERKAKIALFKRSGKVRTYPHRWAVVSGSIDPEDPSPQAAAWREIKEETSLTQSSLELMRQGKSYILPDESIGREWTIYPFAFRLKDTSEGGKGEEGITLDWEHDDWAWYDPFEIEDSESFGAVPRLAESLRRVWFEKGLGDDAGAVLTAGLDRLKNDHQSGARQLAGAALQIMRDIVFKMETQQPTDKWWTKVRFAAWHIWKNGRESMGAAILSALLAALKPMEEILQQQKSTTEARDALVAELDRRIAARQHAAKAISIAFASFLQDQFASRVESHKPIKILTLSESSTITYALRHVIATSPVFLDVRILESRPLFEGVSLASSLLSDVSSHGGHKVTLGGEDACHAPHPKLQLTLFTDASSALASQGVDIVLLGADRISDSGDVSNKTGSLPAVLSAKHVSSEAKTVILSEQEKVAPPGAEHAVENNDATQMTRAWKAEYNSETIKQSAGTVSRSLGGSAAAGRPASANAASCVEIQDISFEWVPASLVDVFVTEHGIATLRDIRDLSKALGSDEERFFSEI
ncbi:hypothetical protein N0V93_003041 [Gnomoniopsis smithogilvyi]|uniref:Nudix hydrolase domain-containing protein n=1 Tax=Gnomoniopsis smithogilvyi TaxID=1191159 RepID=A0A9W8YXV8_9PEZI|nr:hypothetical protein N0V93_003041 [Gnomoniopsis smithogilvyi]